MSSGAGGAIYIQGGNNPYNPFGNFTGPGLPVNTAGDGVSVSTTTKGGNKAPRFSLPGKSKPK